MKTFAHKRPFSENVIKVNHTRKINVYISVKDPFARWELWRIPVIQLLWRLVLSNVVRLGVLYHPSCLVWTGPRWWGTCATGQSARSAERTVAFHTPANAWCGAWAVRLRECMTPTLDGHSTFFFCFRPRQGSVVWNNII